MPTILGHHTVPLGGDFEVRETWVQIPTCSYQLSERGQIISFLLALATLSINEEWTLLP